MNKKISRITALVVVLCMIFTTVAFASPKDKRYEGFNKKHDKYEFEDEDYEEALYSLIKNQIVKGFGNGDYGMSGNVKRGDVIVMIIRMLNNYNKDYNIGRDEIKSVFEDVYGDEYYAESIIKAWKLGIAKGDGKKFHPNTSITVQEVIWLVERTGDMLGLDFNDDDIEYLEEVFSDRLNKPAKRQEVFLILNYLIISYELDNDNDNDNDNEAEDLLVEFTLEKDENEIFFTTKRFTASFNEYLDENNMDDDLKLDYITFDDDYENPVYVYGDDDEDEENIDDDKEYYTSGNKNLIKNIKYARKNNSSQKVEIPFNAYDNENNKHKGTIIITVEKNEKNKVLKDITYNMLEDETIQFNKNDFDNSIEKIKFVLPDKKVGALYYGTDSSNLSKITDEEYSYSRIDRIFFIPNSEFYGKTAEVEYTATTKENTSVKGSIIINVLAVKSIGEIDEVEIDEDEKETIEFTNKLDSKLPKGVKLEDIDYVRFTEPSEGSLWVLGAKVDSDKKYNDMSKLKEIVYMSSDDEPDDIVFYAVDSSELIIYTGTIKIELED